MIFVWDKLLFIVFQFHLIRYTQDGVLAIKTDDELEHEEVKERMEFWVGDTVLCEWELILQQSWQVVVSSLTTHKLYCNYMYLVKHNNYRIHNSYTLYNIIWDRIGMHSASQLIVYWTRHAC